MSLTGDTPNGPCWWTLFPNPNPGARYGHQYPAGVVLQTRPLATKCSLTIIRRQVGSQLPIVAGRLTASFKWGGGPSPRLFNPGEYPYLLHDLHGADSWYLERPSVGVSLSGVGPPSPIVTVNAAGDSDELTIDLSPETVQEWTQLIAANQSEQLPGQFVFDEYAPGFTVTNTPWEFPGSAMGRVEVPLARLISQCELQEEVLDAQFEHTVQVEPCAVVSSTAGLWSSPGYADQAIIFGADGGTRTISASCPDPRTFSAFVQLVTAWSVAGATSLITDRRLAAEDKSTAVLVKPTAHCPQYSLRVFASQSGTPLVIADGHVLWSFNADWQVAAPPIYTDLTGQPLSASVSLPTLVEVPEAVVTATAVIICGSTRLFRDVTMPTSRTADVIFEL